MTKHNQTGHIDMRGLFQAVALRLKGAIDQGRLLHKTRNIRDSGAAFEHEFRSFVASRLPAPFSVKTGYLFAPNSTCTPQIDCIITDNRESHEIMRSDEGAAYVPYPAGRVLIEIKQSANSIAKYINQTAAIRKSIDSMRLTADRYRRHGSKKIDSPLYSLIIGDSSGANIKSFQSEFTNENAPDVTLLLDKAVIIARDSVASEFFTIEGRDGINRPVALDNFDLRQGGEWGVWTPEGRIGDCGHALLWFYFAVIVDLNRSETDNRGAILDFTDQIARDFPMVLDSKLSAAVQWPKPFTP